MSSGRDIGRSAAAAPGGLGRLHPIEGPRKRRHLPNSRANCKATQEQQKRPKHNWITVRLECACPP